MKFYSELCSLIQALLFMGSRMYENSVIWSDTILDRLINLFDLIDFFGEPQRVLKVLYMNAIVNGN